MVKYMKILHVGNCFPPALGGAERHTYMQALIQSNLGNNVSVYTTDMTGTNNRLNELVVGSSLGGFDLGNDKEDCCYNIPNVDVKRFKVIEGNPLYYYFSPTMITALLKSKPDILHAHFFGSFPVDASINIMHRKKIPIVWTLHGIFERKTPFKRFVGHIYNKFISLTTFKNADKIIAISRGEKEQIIKMFNVPEEKIEVVWNGADITMFKRQDTSHFKREFGLNEYDIVIGFVGRICKVKGTDVLIKSMNTIIKEYPRCVLLVIGPDYGLLEYCTNMVRDMKLQNNVIFVGEITGRRLLEAYSCMDIFVAPSRWEPFGNVITEAMSMELPVISTYTPGPIDIIVENKTGYLVDLNEKDLADKTLHLISDTSLRKKMGINGRIRVENYFTWVKNVDKIMKIYEKLVS